MSKVKIVNFKAEFLKYHFNSNLELYIYIAISSLTGFYGCYTGQLTQLYNYLGLHDADFLFDDMIKALNNLLSDNYIIMTAMSKDLHCIKENNYYDIVKIYACNLELIDTGLKKNIEC